jgi:hypothetical protein
MRIKTGDVVVRNIEGMEFEARVLEVNQKSATVTLEYLDDGNTESDVPFDEIQEIIEGKSDSISQSMSKNGRKIETLAKPLFGLVEDDHEIRKNHQPKVVIHEVLGEDDGKAAIILNGAENKLAAGGGLRALRYLKK